MVSGRRFQRRRLVRHGPDRGSTTLEPRDLAARWLPRVAVLETVSVLVLFLNRATLHLDAVTSLVAHSTVSCTC